jgi:hypothetical protein
MHSLDRQTMARMHVLVRVALSVVVLVAGCRSDPAPPPTTSTPSRQPSNWPEKLSDFRFRWSAEPGGDLDTGQAVALRAYLESWLIILYAGYPGFQQATPELLERGSPEWVKTAFAQRQIRGYRGKPSYHDPNKRMVGNENLHLLRSEPLDKGFRTFVCDATYGVYEQSADSTQFTPLNLDISTSTKKPDVHNMRVWRIEFSDHDPRVGATHPASPTTSQQGPLPAPRTDVFGPWFVTGAEEVSLWSDSDYPGLSPGSPEDLQRTHETIAAETDMREQCLDRYPLNAEQRTKLATTVIDKPPTVEPALPGWPE